MERLIKSALGQWKLIGDTLKKTKDGDPVPAPAPLPANNDMKESRDKLTSLFSEQNEHAAADRGEHAHSMRGKIKDMVLNAPKGMVDIGHLARMQDNQIAVGKGEHPEFKHQPVTREDMEEMINHHLGHHNSLKQIHDKHGIKGVEAVLRTVGSDAAPRRYTGLKFKNPNVYLDAMHLMNPGKDVEDRSEPGARAEGIFPNSAYHKTRADPQLHDDVVKKYNDVVQSDDEDDDSTSQNKRFEDAVTKRGLDIFKRHHKLD